MDGAPLPGFGMCPMLVGEVLSLSAAAVWLAWLVLYGLKWITSREEAVAEFRHPIQAFFIALVPVATLIAGDRGCPVPAHRRLGDVRARGREPGSVQRLGYG